MTDRQTPATAAGRRHARNLQGLYSWSPDESEPIIIAIEAEARADGMMQGMGASYQEGRADALREAAEALSIIRDAMNDASLRHENVRLTREQARLIRAALSEAEARASLDVDVLARAMCDKPPGVCFDWDIHVTQARAVAPRYRAILAEQKP